MNDENLKGHHILTLFHNVELLRNRISDGFSSVPSVIENKNGDKVFFRGKILSNIRKKLSNLDIARKSHYQLKEFANNEAKTYLDNENLKEYNQQDKIDYDKLHCYWCGNEVDAKEIKASDKRINEIKKDAYQYKFLKYITDGVGYRSYNPIIEMHDKNENTCNSCLKLMTQSKEIEDISEEIIDRIGNTEGDRYYYEPQELDDFVTSIEYFLKNQVNLSNALKTKLSSSSNDYVRELMARRDDLTEEQLIIFAKDESWINRFQIAKRKDLNYDT